MFTTLSQHETALSLAGSRFKSHIEVDFAIAERSSYLRIYLPHHVRDDRPLLPIQLGDVDPTGFKLYIEWLTHGFVSCSTRRPLRLQSCIDLIYAHIVGSTFSQSHFQDYIIDTLAFILDPAQVFDQEVLELLFLEKHASGALRKFVTDKMFRHDRRMLGMMRNSVEDIVTAYSDVKGCEYHIHQDGVCYKYGMANDDKDATRNVGVAEKKWNLDDDPELNAMAAEYLGKTNATLTITRELSPKISSQSKKTIATKHRIPTSERRSREQSRVLQPKRPSLHGMPPLNPQHPPQTSIFSNSQSPCPSIQALTTNAHIDKPLPPPPPLGQSPSPLSFKFTVPMHKDRFTVGGTAMHKPSKQDIVLECLRRLSPALSRTPTQDVIHDHFAHPPSSTPSLTDSSDSHISLFASNKSVLPTPSPPPPSVQLFPPSLHPGSTSSTYHQPRNTTSPASPRKSTSSQSVAPSFPNIHTFNPHAMLPPVQRPYHISPSSPSLPHFAPLIKRKPVPARGKDWLEQQDRLFALQGTQGFGLKKGDEENVVRKGDEENVVRKGNQGNVARKSRFMEILGGVGKVDGR
ncbi:hypothetical protein G6011_00145 [Alternaria panax]|uniref:Uncharacterized protein n=1 Tax=Alternaria panax TaxID=48097 RepID=A0AAD4NVG4_9PLEO|nr:hypothetical protein G6011_00145 [Alternaria panax]